MKFIPLFQGTFAFTILESNYISTASQLIVAIATVTFQIIYFIKKYKSEK